MKLVKGGVGIKERHAELVKYMHGNNDELNASIVGAMQDKEFAELIERANIIHNGRMEAAQEYRNMLLRDIYRMVGGGKNLLVPLEFLKVADLVKTVLGKEYSPVQGATTEELTAHLAQAEYYRCIVDAIQKKACEVKAFEQ